MLDSEGSAECIRGSENTAAREQVASTMTNRQSTNGDKLEEFEKLLQSMLPSRTPSQEEEEPEETETEKKIGLPFLQPLVVGYTLFYFIIS